MARWRVSSRLVVATLIALGIVAAGTAVGWMAVGNSDRAIRATAAAAAVGRHARSLAETATAPTRADMSPEAVAESRASMDADAAAARSQLDLLTGAGHADAAARMRALLAELTKRAEQLEGGRPEYAQILRDSQSSREELIAATNWQLLPAAVASEDELFGRLVADRGARDGQSNGTPGAISEEDLLMYARLALLAQQLDQGYIALEVATRLTDSEFIGTVEENVNLAMYQLRENIESLSGTDRQDLAPELVPLALDLVDAAYGETNLIDLMKTRLRLEDREAQLAESVNTVASALDAEVDAVLEQAIGELERRDATRESALALQSALSVLRNAAAVAAHWSAQTTSGTPVDEMPEIRATVTDRFSDMREGLDALGDAGYGAAVVPMYPQIDLLESTSERIHSGRPELADALLSAERERAQLRSFVDYQLEPAVVTSLDNQLYYMLTGRSEFRDGDPADSDPLSHVEFIRYWHLASVYNSLFRTFSGLIIAIIMTESTLIGEGEERFITASHRLERSIDYLERDGGAETSPQLVPLARQFIGFGSGESSAFDLLRQRLPLIASEREAIAANRQVHAGLLGDMNALLDRILQSSSSTAGAFRIGGAVGPRTTVLTLGILAAVLVLLVAGSVALRGGARAA